MKLHFPSPLFCFHHSPVEKANLKQECDVETAKASHSPSTENTAVFKDKSCISKEEPCYDSCASEDPHADNTTHAEEDCKGTKKSKVELKQVENEAQVAFPDPRLPYPCLSSLSSEDQRKYLNLLMNKNTRKAPEVATFSPQQYFDPDSPCCIA